MKVYIPFNSNDFNNIFSTLSISPYSFYSFRNFGYKRANKSIFNNLENYLVAYQYPIFTTKDFSNDDGYVINIEIDLANDYVGTKAKSITYYLISDTIYLFGFFKLVFRSEFELKEVFARSLKSIETKFVHAAKANSVLVKEFSNVLWVDTTFKLKNSDLLANKISFALERKINKALGSTLGFFIGLSSSVGGEYGRLKQLKRELENLSAVFVNSISSKVDNGEKERILNCLNEIYTFYDALEPLDEKLMLNTTGIDTKTYSILSNSSMYGFNILDLIKSGLMSRNFENLPMQLLINLAKRNIGAKYNMKYPESYLSRIEENIFEIGRQINNLISSKKSTIEFVESDLLVLDNGDPLTFSLTTQITSLEKKYLESVLDFFVAKDDIINTESFFSQRGLILTQLGNHLKIRISEFDNSEEKRFLLNLFDSFKNLRSAFNPRGTESEVFKSIAILFTSGRDLYKFFDNVIYAGVENLSTSLSIWGAVYGLSSIPKTYTDEILSQSGRSKILSNVFKRNLGVLLNSTEGLTKIDNILSTPVTDDGTILAEPVAKESPSGLEAETAVVSQDNVQLVFQNKLNAFEAELRKDKILNKEDIILLSKRAFTDSYEPGTFDKVSNDNFDKLLKSSLKIKAKKAKFLTPDVIKKIMTSFKAYLDSQEIRSI